NNNNGLNWIYSTDSGATWTCGGQLSTDTDTNQTIGTAPNADARVDSSDNIYVVYSGVTYRGTGFDVFYRKLTKGTGASWTVGNAQTALDSTSGTTGYSYSVMELEGSTRLWLATRYFDGTNYQIQVYYSGDLSDAPTWTQSAASLDTAGASSNYHKLTIVRFGPKIGIIYADQGSGGDLKWRYRADSDDLTSWNAEATISTTFSAIYPTFSAVSDTSNNIYLAVNDGTVVYFTYYNGSGWSSLATVSSVAASDQYVSLETDNTSVWVVYGQTTDLSAFLVAYDYNTLVYKKGVAPFATANFDANSTRVVSYHRIFDKVWTYISSAYTDDTTDAGDTGSNDVAMPAVTGDIIYFGMDEKFDAIAFELYTDGEGGIIAWEYYNGSAWMPLNVYFDTALSLFAGDGGYISFNPHTDWATTQINGEGTAYYYVRARVITDFTITPAGVMMVAMPTVNYASVADTPAGLFAIWTENRYGPTRVRYQTILTHPITASQDVRFKGTTRIQGPIRIKLN
ncbi:MAG: hypothetical protein Q8O55_09965, partial [Dehalococcoidales bacterium]|nr:hypothetical protein [Dehalococcoidales bacterium]